MPWLIPWIIQNIACRQERGALTQSVRHGMSSEASTLSIRPSFAMPRARTSSDESCAAIDDSPTFELRSAASCASSTSWYIVRCSGV